MHAGQIISGTGHAALILWALFGGVFRSAPDEMQVQEVSVISSAEFEALRAGDISPETPPEVAEAPQAPEVDEAPPVEAPAPDAPPERPAPPEVAAAEPDPVPEPLPDPVPAPLPEPAPEPEEIAPPAEDVAILIPERSPRPRPRPAERIAPEPVAQPEPEVDVAPEIVPDTAPAETETPAPETDTAAPEETTTEIVNADEVPSGAPDQSRRPRTRPDRPTPAPTPTREARTQETDAPAASDPLAAALAEASDVEVGGADRPAAAPAGPPLTRGEREGLRVAVEACWVVDVGSQAANVTVTLAMEMTPEGRVLSDTIEMIGSEGGDRQSAQVAFQAARRAVLRCEKGGYNLPRDKYEHWREIEMTFNPEKMRSR